MKRILCIILLFTFLGSNNVFLTLYDDLTGLEKSLADKGLKEFFLTPTNDLLNKKVAHIYIMTMQPFSNNTGLFGILNKMHTNTKEDLIRSQIFIKTGDIYDAALIQDSEIYLRNQSTVRSLAVIVPALGKDTNPNEIDLLIITKDIVSLKPGFNIEGLGLGSDFYLTKLLLSFGEHNLGGQNLSILGSYELSQGAQVTSLRYIHPHLFGSYLRAYLKPSLVFLRNGKPDGFLGDVSLERPLLCETDHFGYGMSLSFQSRTIIDFLGNKVRLVNIPSNSGTQKMEKKYRFTYGSGSLFGRYSMGREVKNEWLFGYGLIYKAPSILDEDRLNQKQQDYFKKYVLPKEEMESFINLGFSHFKNQFLNLYNYNSYQIQETIRLGPSLSISNDFAFRLIGSDHNFLRPQVKFSYTHQITKDGFISLTLKSQHRLQNIFTDNSYYSLLTFASPNILKLGRLVFENYLASMQENRDNNKFYLGSDSGLRGISTRFYTGDNIFRTNLEMRFSPWAIWGIYAGFICFYDAGSAFINWNKVNPTHSLGFGLRILAPQLSSSLFRIDIAFPIFGPGQKEHTILPSFGTGQAF